jgi:signal transduction histidine kinase/ligand-binding sensor domain-containing protein
MIEAAYSRIICLLSILFVLSISRVFSQSILAPGVLLYPGNLGLQQNTITCIYEGGNGKMWVSTFGGLHQFDGHSFRHIAFPNTTELPTNDVIRSIIESGDSLLLASETAIFSYHPASGRFNPIITNSKNTFTLLKVTGELLYFYDFHAGALKTIHLKSGKQDVLFADGIVREVYEMSYASGQLYLITNSYTVIKIDIATRKQVEIVSPEPIKQIVGIKNLGFVLATQKHIFLYANSYLKELTGLQFQDYFRSVTAIGQQLYLQIQNGWFSYNLVDDEHMYFSESQIGIPNYLTGKTTCVFKDASGNLWMGKDGFGMVQMNRLYWQFNQGLSLKTRGSFVRSMAESHGTIWAGTQYLELLEIKGDTVIKHALPLQRLQSAIHAIDSLDQDNLLLATDIGLWTFTISTQKFNRLKSKGTDKMTTSLKRIGNSWLVCRLLEKDIILGSIAEKSLTVDATYPVPGIVRCFSPSTDNNVLLGMREGGLLSLNLKTGSLTELPQFDKKQIIQISRTGNNWLFASANGLLIADKSLNLLQQSASNSQAQTTHCYAVMPLGEKKYWVSTNSGLMNINGNLSATYSSRNGLQSDEFNGRCALLLRNGNLAFGGVNGISIFNPNSISADSIAPLPYLQSCTNAGIEIGANQLLKGDFAFGEGHFNMHLHFAVTNYTISEKNMLALALLAIGSTDTVWQNINATRDYYLQGLRANSYILLAKAANADGLWSDEVVIATFSISPVFYKTWWFLGLLFFVAMGVVWYLIYLYAQRKEAGRQAEFLRIKELADMRQQIADDIHDDLGAGLTKLALMADRLALKSPTESTEIKPLGAVARNLTKSLKEVIWATKPENDNLCELQRHVIALISEMLADTQIQLKLDVDDCTSNAEVSPIQRQHVFQFVREAVHNCIKHAQATTLLFQFKTIGGKVLIYLKDDGIGFNPETIVKGNGSQTQMRRATALEAHYALISTPGGPTETKLEFTL